MSEYFERPSTPSFNSKIEEQEARNANHSLRTQYQFQVPLTPPFGTLSVDCEEQEVKGLATITNLNGSSQFKVPTTPFPDIMETPIPSMSSKKVIHNPRTQSVNDAQNVRQQIARYSDWLAGQAKLRALNDSSQERNDYILNASKVVKVGRKEVEIFAPFQPDRSALKTLTIQQIIVLCVIGMLLVGGIALFQLEMLTAIITAIILLYSGNMILSFVTAIRSFKNSPEEQIDDAVIYGLDNVNC